MGSFCCSPKNLGLKFIDLFVYKNKLVDTSLQTPKIKASVSNSLGQVPIFIYSQNVYRILRIVDQISDSNEKYCFNEYQVSTETFQIQNFGSIFNRRVDINRIFFFIDSLFSGPRVFNLNVIRMKQNCARTDIPQSNSTICVIRKCARVK